MAIIYVDTLEKLRQMMHVNYSPTMVNTTDSDRLPAPPVTPLVVAIDTEFDRSNTFYAKLGLIQLSFSMTPEYQYLLDTIQLDLALVAREGRLLQLLADTSVVKVVHACGEDIDALLHNFGLKSVENPIVNLFDTQVAAAYLNLGNQVSYRDLVKHYHDVDLAKGETRSDWIARPLTSSQIQYAAKDVEYLLTCYQKMRKSLEQQNRLHWVCEDSDRFVRSYLKTEALDRYYLKFQKGWNLDPSQVALLRDLCIWREETARYMDTPRTHIVRDSSLFEIATQQPNNVKGLLGLKSLQGKSKDIRHVKRFADQILEKVKIIDEQGNAEPTLPIDPPLDRDLKDVFKSCKQLVASLAEKWQVTPERLASKNELRHFISAYANFLYTKEPLALSDQMNGWRKDIIVNPLIERLNNFQSELLEQVERRQKIAIQWRSNEQRVMNGKELGRSKGR